ncbi:MAG: MBL fold metallo-hydrolase [Flavobacteriales bacterium]|nr:MBL fold metallo-hydrolase [Flavobacteriales bacterium]
MKIKSFAFNPFQENTYVVYDETKDCIIIDPGCYTEVERTELRRFITSEGLNPVKLINTHCHIDHVLGNKFVSELWELELYIHKEDLPVLENVKDISGFFGFENYERSPSPKHFLAQGDTLNFGDSSFKILFTPGHAPGHICLYSTENNLVIAGDVLFQGSIGRTDLPGGDHNTLINSIKTQLFPLPNETQVYCGHGPATNIGYEKEHNPFLQ